MTSSRRATAKSRGFTLVELVIIMAVTAVILTLGLPALQNFIQRSKLEGVARATATMLRNARYEAIKQRVQVVVKIDTATRDVVSFADPNGDAVENAGDTRIGAMQLPSGVVFDGPAAQPTVDGLEKAGTAGWARFGTDGSVPTAGAFRMADSRDNFVEVRVAPAATARILLRKWDGSAWHFQGEGGKNWVWY